MSLIVRNWNYGRYVGQAIDSIKAQDYPHIETIIVDNASSDDSRDVIERHVAGDPRFRVVLSTVNLGPLGGGLLGLDVARGEFITFVDADDMLLANFVSAHVQVHLASRLTVAITSSTAIETTADNLVVAGHRARSIERATTSDPPLRPAEIVPRLDSVDDRTYALLAANTTLIDPSVRGWIWSPGTSNMYRRFVLDMMRPMAAPGVLETLAADGHYNRLCHYFGGSAIIDLPLSSYRIHGDNFYASTPSLASARQDQGPAKKFGALRIRETMRVLNAQAADLAWQIGADRFWHSLATMLEIHSEFDTDPTVEAELATFLSSQMPDLIAAFGEKKAILELAKYLRPRVLRAVLHQHYGASIPIRLRPTIHRIPWARLRQRIRQSLRNRRIRKRERRARR